MSEALERQKKITAVLADRLACLLSWLEEDSLNAWVEGDDAGAEYLERLRAFVFAFDEASEHKRAEQRCMGSYEKGTEATREMTKEILRQIYGKAA